MKGPLRLLFAFSLAAALASGCHKKPRETAAAESAKPSAPAAEKPADDHEPGLRADAPRAGKPSAALAGETAEFAALNPDYEAWFRKYHLDLNDPKMLDEDPDGDGFTNREEFLAGTDPRDPNSRPDGHAGIHKTIRLKEYNEVQVPFVLKSVDGETARIERLDEGPGKIEEVRTGQTLRGSSLKVEKVQANRGTDKDGNPVDASHVTLRNPATKEATVLVKDLPTRSSGTTAVLTSPDGVIAKTVKGGDTFTWPGEEKTTYKVVDIRPDQVVLQEVETGKMWTVPKK